MEIQTRKAEYGDTKDNCTETKLWHARGCDHHGGYSHRRRTLYHRRQCYGQVGIDFVAGPSEVLIIAEETADPRILAADLLTQSEHNINAKGTLLTISKSLGEAVLAAVEAELGLLDTAEIARKSWERFGEVRVLTSVEEAVSFANDCAPEHLEVIVKEPEKAVQALHNYGSLFVGQNTAEVFGDYASGTNHTLPTLRAARYTGGVWVGTFLKTCTHQSMTDQASQTLAPLCKRLAKGEGLSAHAYAAALRKKVQ